MDRLKSLLISIAGLTVILSLAVVLSLPSKETRFQKRAKREDRLLFGGEKVLAGDFSHEEFSRGRNGATLQQVTRFEDDDGNKGKIYFYAHSVQTFTDYSFFDEFLEVGIKVRIKGVRETYVDAFLIDDTGEGILLEKDLSLAGIGLSFRLSRRFVRTEGDYIPATEVALLYNSGGGHLRLEDSKVYVWEPEPVDPMLADYDAGGDTYMVREDFREDLF